jgi:hypothetical protein
MTPRAARCHPGTRWPSPRDPGATMPSMRLGPSLALVPLLTTLLAPPARAADEAPPSPPPAAAPEEDEFQKPPPGSPEDQALWGLGQQVGRDIRATRAEAYRLQSTTRSRRLLERLEAAAKGKPAEEASAIQALRQRLKDEWKANHAYMARRWPVSTVRGCGYALLAFESAMRIKAERGPGADVGSARTDLRSCTDKASEMSTGMASLNRTFGRVIEEAEQRLVQLEPARPPPPRPDPAAAAARADQARRARLAPAASAGQEKKQD